MNRTTILFTIFSLLLPSCVQEKPAVLETGSVKPMPDQWIDQSTGYRLTRLTSPEGNNQSFYFHNNPFIPAVNDEGDLMVFYGSGKVRPDDKMIPRGMQRHLYTLNLKTGEIKQITRRPGFIMGEIVGKRRREVFYQSSDSVFRCNVDTPDPTLIFVFPDSLRGSVTTLNADETILSGVVSSREKMEMLRQFPRKGDYFTRIFEARLPHSLFTFGIETGNMRIIHSDTAWLNHVQFSPTDPELLMFCHEGPWHLLDRVWTINITSGKVQLMHKRSMPMEIAGHEFFSRDGKTIWFDLQRPRGQTFYLAGLSIETNIEKHYAMKRDEWSIHFNISPDQKLFAGDGGDSTQVARAKNGMWIYLFTPGTDSLKAERIVNMKHHDYNLEPNVHFSPDGNRIIFRANFEGTSQIYAVDLRKKYKI